MAYIIVVVIIALLAVVFYICRKGHLEEVHIDFALKKEARKSWSEKKYMSYGEVREIQKALKDEIEKRFDDREKRDLLVEIVSEWAELRIRAFQDRRSWLRKPKVHDVQTPINQSNGKIHH